jgi:hypothetical protein
LPGRSRALGQPRALRRIVGGRSQEEVKPAALGAVRALLQQPLRGGQPAADHRLVASDQRVQHGQSDGDERGRAPVAVAPVQRERARPQA